ncbi:PLP-dependent aminotransferase family protein (plasmid) [Deinococcus sp. KNUC1210]|uniref:MocR-like pyridoxine biosynthesis transcription factor PdxR n=1 Tax=Deinococcus sp. KNUC1210 TaxID=2917691 RepID=UPI001EF0D0EC|nr:PLP-dependent aminotransferase family protein [Deinococcus sp. KNUC1210]ULH13993.1 PLP-dependent aminotransferase family protein [Deinococcus sp. KNUC1210]
MPKTARPLLPRERHHQELELPLELDRSDSRPLPEQLAAQWREAILQGRLAAGARLPSSRVLSKALGITRHVVLLAVDELVIEGYVISRPGSGVTVSADARPPAVSPPSLGMPHRWQRQPVPPSFSDPLPRPGILEFRLGEPSVDRWPEEAWRRVWRETSGVRPPVGYLDPQGEPELRETVAAYLRRTRGLNCQGDQVLITSSSLAALSLLIRATVAPGDLVGLEEPGYLHARHILLQRGADLQACPVDDDGLRIDTLPVAEAAPGMLYCTPSHQYPLGGRMALPRRAALLDWAEAHNVLVVEDDYDSEFRFDTAPLPALASLDRFGRVAYLGTFSKSLTPALRVGYLVGPTDLIARLLRFRQLTGDQVSWPVQHALAAFIQGGHLERHIGSMRREYARKRAALLEVFRP